MRMNRCAAVIAAALVLTAPVLAAAAPAAGETDSKQLDPVHILVGRLDLERYKATVKGLTQFGDRRQGTDRNRAAVDWIEAKLKSYGCTNTERIKNEDNGGQLRNDSTNKVDSARALANPAAARGGRGGGAGGDSTAAPGRGGRSRG